MSSAAFAARVMRFGLRIPQRLMSGAMRAAMGTITHVETEEAVAALTFDDGPHPVYTWSLQADDWMQHDAIWTADHLERHINPGSIILLHDMLWDLSVKEAADRSAMLEGLDRFLDRMRGRYRFLTVPELLRTGR